MSTHSLMIPSHYRIVLHLGVENKNVIAHFEHQFDARTFADVVKCRLEKGDFVELFYGTALVDTWGGNACKCAKVR